MNIFEIETFLTPIVKNLIIITLQLLVWHWPWKWQICCNWRTRWGREKGFPIHWKWLWESFATTAHWEEKTCLCYVQGSTRKKCKHRVQLNLWNCCYDSAEILSVLLLFRWWWWLVEIMTTCLSWIPLRPWSGERIMHLGHSGQRHSGALPLVEIHLYSAL